MADPSPRQIVRTVRDYAREHGLLPPGPIVLAVSGGTDSTALALVLAELRETLGLVLHVAHFDHRARPDAAAADAAFVADLANRIDAPLRVGRAERVPASEDEARRARYAFLRRAAADAGATRIATGHTRDDQAETVLLHLTRGSGIAGLAGMRPERDGIVRPLLAIGRAETAAVCGAAGIRPREDETNASLRFARNRVRLRVLPELERINPRVREALARFADAAAELEPADAQPRPPIGEIDVARLPSGPARERMLAAAWRSATGRTLSATQRAALDRLAATTAGTRSLDLPGGAAVRAYGRLRLGVRDATAPAAPRAPARLERGRPVEWHGWRIAVDVASDGFAYHGRVRADDAARLLIRSRRPGDRVAGVRGKVQDLFVNAKVPVADRDGWPIVTLDERIVWIPGITAAPRTGRIPIAAGRVGDAPTGSEGTTVGPARVPQVASTEEDRRGTGGKRGRP